MGFKSPPWDLTGFDIESVPHYGNLTSWYVKSPLKPHLCPKGGGVVGEFIDRCIRDNTYL